MSNTKASRANGCTHDETEREHKRAKLENLHVTTIRPLIPPACVIEELPVTPKVFDTVSSAREAISNVLHGYDDRLVVVVGPCSIHDIKSGLEYGTYV